ncbi:MAG: hypothetical protein GXO78_15435 [Calditrichaeota bacterium]|nr:hypothetical protein [Calditrichota bacterium]
MKNKPERRGLIDGSRLIIESLARAGADVYVGYPITPSNWLYAYARQRFPLFLPAPDEITALQWAAGFSATGRFPVTATSFPGFALMLESVNMAYMMELPMVIILAQRMGPSTGSATTGAQGDVLLLRGAISGGYPLPVFCPSNLEDCWKLSAEAMRMALTVRTPVVLLTSKEMVMTHHSFDLSCLPAIRTLPRETFKGNGEYLPYAAAPAEAPPFLPVGNPHHQVRLNASTHDATGLIRKATPEALSNTRRLRDKIDHHIKEFTHLEYDPAPGASVLIVSYGISSEAAREAVQKLRTSGKAISLLIIKTLLPVPTAVFDILQKYPRVVIVEENLTGLLRELFFGQVSRPEIRGVNRIGALITPSEIVQEVESWQQ